MALATLLGDQNKLDYVYIINKILSIPSLSWYIVWKFLLLQVFES